MQNGFSKFSKNCKVGGSNAKKIQPPSPGLVKKNLGMSDVDSVDLCYKEPVPAIRQTLKSPMQCTDATGNDPDLIR